MKKLSALLFALTSSLFACSQEAQPDTTNDNVVDAIDSTELLPSLHPIAKFTSMQTGQVEVQPSLNFNKWNAQQVGHVDLSNLKGSDATLRMIAVGGGLTAGVCNGGLYRESQQFAYPNLVAHQMGLTDFEMPLFSEQDFNGTGYYLYDNPLAKYPKWKKVINNRAPVTGGAPPVLPRYEGNASNFATPWGASTWLSYPYCEKCMTQPYVSRLSTLKATPQYNVLSEILEKRPYNFVLLDDFFDRWIQGLQENSHINHYTLNFNGSIYLSGTITDYTLNAILGKGQRGVIFTVPHYRTLPYMNWYKVSELIGASTNSDASYLVPSPFVSRIFEKHEPGSKFTSKLDPLSVIDAEEALFSDPETMYNPKIKEYAEKHNLAVVDLYEVYEKIHTGSYVSDDGVPIDGTMKGNFFSADGIYPTALGQAIIANETIKAINEKYHTRIPLISIKDFVKTIGFKN
ncbi:hypothetical protein [Dyadobacter jiangsuensis]|uniref:GDSL-like lipase/acylhydrolase family protein n=1 Tax=Dyadobacter jiangsuensis TaxID=1591085 RepID=A0A2P8G5G9_9BACT|nr:hypothetical protein [Dyadobacter jiangsuensis]PSL29209.1 hypothetical protein CLV60_10544 [Dyadobacter jiangsuensis]